MALLVKHSDPDRHAWVRGSPDETPPCTLMSPGACKICHGFNVLLIPIQNYNSGATKAGELSPLWRINIVMACLQTILGHEYQTVSNSPRRCCSQTLRLVLWLPKSFPDIKLNLPTYLPFFFSVVENQCICLTCYGHGKGIKMILPSFFT